MFENLLKYQETEASLIAIENEVGKSEERKRVQRAKNFLNETDSTISKMDLKAAELSGIYEKLQKKSEELMEELTELDGLAEKSKDETELNYLAKKKSRLDDEIDKADKDMQNLNAEIRKLLQTFDEYRKKFKATKEEFEIAKKEFDLLKSSKKEEIEKINVSLKEIENSIDPKLFERYKTVREKKIYPALVELSPSSVCTGCGMEVSLAKISKLDLENLIECDECGRLIYKK